MKLIKNILLLVFLVLSVLPFCLCFILGAYVAPRYILDDPIMLYGVLAQKISTIFGLDQEEVLYLTLFGSSFISSVLFSKFGGKYMLRKMFMESDCNEK
jgi:hypothetical protein